MFHQILNLFSLCGPHEAKVEVKKHDMKANSCNSRKRISCSKAYFLHSKHLQTIIYNLIIHLAKRLKLKGILEYRESVHRFKFSKL